MGPRANFRRSKLAGLGGLGGCALGWKGGAIRADSAGWVCPPLPRFFEGRGTEEFSE